MTYLTLYLVSFALFLGLDFLGLGRVVKPVFEKHIPDLLLESPRLGPALLFYAFYIFGLVWFVSAPALEMEHSLLWVAGNAALIGAIGFGTYEFTSLAVTKGWSWEMVIVDLTWGVVMTGLSGVVGVWVTRMIF